VDDQDDPRLEVLLSRFANHLRHVSEFAPDDMIWCANSESDTIDGPIYPCRVVGLFRDDEKKNNPVVGLVIQMAHDLVEALDFEDPFDAVFVRTDVYDPQEDDQGNSLIAKLSELSDEEYRELRTYQDTRYWRRLRQIKPRV
jgi:hypothetical protein